MNIAFAASEAAPFLKTGGLGDVMQALPEALRQSSEHEVVLVLPYYGVIKRNPAVKTEFCTAFAIRLGWRNCHVGVFRLCHRKKRLQVYFVDNEQYFDRGRIYGEPDDGERFAYFSKAVPACLNAVGFHPDVLHCNDWQTALIPLLLKSEFAASFPGTKSVLTIHNVQYQGWGDILFNMDVLGLPAEYTGVLEMKGASNMLKAGIVMADAVNTVSETYARELQYPYYAHGLDQVLRDFSYKITGITNGIDTNVWDPAHDALLAENFSAADAAEKKKKNKLALQEQVGLTRDEDSALLAMVTRLADHKGIDLLTCVADRLMERRVQLVVLGTGEAEYEEFLRGLEARYPGRVAAILQFDGGLANRIYAASDIYLMPSKSEPCGLSQLIAMRYGSVPVVHATGGLRDTVPPYEGPQGEGRGFTFQSYNADDFLAAIDRALAVYYDMPTAWAELRAWDMRQDLSWKIPAKQYEALYRRITES
ncbi:MAG: glycogen synthase [Oscillospiraceae bacterium]|nr:glycogen synthase [Oscillospiraceae bacterium]